MRRLARPLSLFALLCGFAALSQAQLTDLQTAPGGGFNLLTWQKGYPVATTGGVDLAVDIKPTAGWTCTEVTFRVIDDATNKTLDTATISNPGATASKSFTGLQSNLKVRVTADATFQNLGAFDFKDLEEWVTTK